MQIENQSEDSGIGEPEPIRIAYITSLGHSGSTLLDMLISSHSQAMTLGEVHRLNLAERGRCACGAENYRQCPFWQRVDQALQQSAGRPLGNLQLHSEDDATFRQDNRLLLKTLQELTGVRLFVDSSKKVSRLKRLVADPAFSVIPIHLIRRPQGVVYSNVKKGRPWLSQTFNYITGTRSRRHFLQKVRHFEVRYEDLCLTPEAILRKTMHQLGLAFEQSQLEWASHEHHNVNGNIGTRSSDDSSIRLDEAWRRHLPLYQRLAIGLLTRFPQRHYR